MQMPEFEPLHPHFGARVTNVDLSRALDDEARALIDELLEFATQPQYVYTHQWRGDDAVLWDNRAVVHRGRPFARDTHPRIMIRTTIADDGPTVRE